MQALRIMGSLQCVRELQCLQTRRRIIWVQLLALFQPQFLAMGGSSPSLSTVTFFVNFNSGATICHGVPHRRSQFVGSPSITQCLSCAPFASQDSILGNAQNCSSSSMMTNEDSLIHAACKRTDTIFSNFTEPNFLSKLRHWLSPSSTSSPHFTRLSVVANSHVVHGNTHTGVLFFENSESSALSFHFSHNHLNTTVGHVITLRWSLRNHFHSNTCVNHRILECFRVRFTIAFQNDSAKNKIFDETNKKFNGVCCGTFPFTTCRSRLTIPAVSTNQNWKPCLRFPVSEKP